MESYDSFIERLASPSPAPGGGAASAMVSVVASSLNRMVANLTVNKKKYAEYSQEMSGIIEKSKSIDNELRQLMKEDEDAFNGIMKALKLPRETEQEKAARKEELVKATKEAINAPWKIARASRDVLELSLTLAEHGNRNAITDAACAALFADAAVRGVLYNVSINLKSIPDAGFVGEQERSMKEFLEECERLKSRVTGIVDKTLGDE